MIELPLRSKKSAFSDGFRGPGGGVLKEFLGRDVPLGPWNP